MTRVLKPTVEDKGRAQDAHLERQSCYTVSSSCCISSQKRAVDGDDEGIEQRLCSFSVASTACGMSQQSAPVEKPPVPFSFPWHLQASDASRKSEIALIALAIPVTCHQHQTNQFPRLGAQQPEQSAVNQSQPTPPLANPVKVNR